jgi:Fur family transcriptional regulator, ferric uptake regulator
MQALDSVTSQPDPWSELLHAKGLRGTLATKRVLSCLQSTDEPLSHDAIEHLLQADSSASPIDRVTLYRILERLCQAGLARKISHSDRTWRFALASQDESGIFECDTCHQLTPLEQDAQLSEAMALIGSYLKTKGLASTQSFVNAHGVCAKCVS